MILSTLSDRLPQQKAAVFLSSRTAPTSPNQQRTSDGRRKQMRGRGKRKLNERRKMRRKRRYRRRGRDSQVEMKGKGGEEGKV